MRSWAEHTGELELELGAETPSGLFEEAAIALGELLRERGEPDAGATGTRSIDVSATAPDRPALLAEWLSELAYRAERDGLVPACVERIELAESSVEAIVETTRLDVPHLVKAVTYHRLGMWREGDAWRARVVLDV